MSAEVEYDAVDLRVGPVPLPTKTRRKRPVKIIKGDGFVPTEEVAPGILIAKVADTDAIVKRETDTDAMLPDAYRVFGLETVTREDAKVKTKACSRCGLVFVPHHHNIAMCPMCRGKCECGALIDGGRTAKLCKECRGKKRCEYARKARSVLAELTPDQRSEKIRKALARLTPEQRSEIARTRQMALTPEQRSEAARKAQAAMTPEQRSEAARRRQSALTPERRSEAARKGNATRRSRERTGDV